MHLVRKIAQRYNASMLLEASTVRSYFSELGLDSDAANLYLTLFTEGPQNMSDLARSSGMERTRVYRLVDKLKDAHLLSNEKSAGQSLLRAAPIANLHILLNKKEQEVKSLQDKLWVIERLLANSSLTSPTTQVQFYQGAEGVRQMFWNETKATSENLSILYQNMQGKTEEKYFSDWVHQCNDRDLKFRGIICDNFIKSQQSWYQSHSNERLMNWESRYISPEVFDVTHSMVIYDDVVAYYVWKDAEIFGVEIVNRQIADAQRTFFEMLWRQAQPVEDVTGKKL